MRLRYTEVALAELAAILDDKAIHAPQSAQRVQARIKVIIDLLLQHPRIGTRTDDPAIRRMTTLQYPYLVFYEPTDSEIIIHAVRHGARDPADMPGAS